MTIRLRLFVALLALCTALLAEGWAAAPTRGRGVAPGFSSLPAASGSSSVRSSSSSSSIQYLHHHHLSQYRQTQTQTQTQQAQQGGGGQPLQPPQRWLTTLHAAAGSSGGKEEEEEEAGDLIEPVQALPSDLAAKVINNNFKGKKKTAGAKGGAKKKAPAATETTAAAAEAKGSKGTKKKTKTTTKGKKKGAAAAVEEEAAAKTEAAAAPLKNTAAEVQAMADRSLAAELINGKFKAIALEKEVAERDEQLEASAALLRETLQIQHAAKAQAEAEAAATEAALKASEASVAELTKSYGDLMVSSHEAKLAAVAAAEAPLKAELASLQARLDASEAEVTAVREEGRATMVQLAMDAAAKRSKVAEELSASHGLVAEAEARAGELETALQDYMVKAHKAKITSEEVAAKGAAKQTKKESDAAAGSSLEELQRLRRELTDLQAERDDYVKEREAELAALGDGLPPQ